MSTVDFCNSQAVQGKATVIRRQTLCATSMLMFALAGGCTKLGPDFVQPDAPVADDWTEAANPQFKKEAPDHAAWWRVFNDPTLDRLIETAYQQNLTLQIAGLRTLEARAALGIAKGNLYPQVQQARGGASFNSQSENVANTQLGDLNFWNYDAGFDAAWEIDFWGRIRRGIESADANLHASVADYDDLLVSLTAEVADAYTMIRTFQERLRLARENVVIQERSLKIAKIRFRNGATTELDVEQARTLLRNTQASVPRLSSGLRQAENALSTLLGVPPGQVESMLGQQVKIPVAPQEVAVGIPAEYLRRRPDVRQAELQAAAQSALIGIAKADLYPSFSLVGSLGLAASGGTNSTRSGKSGVDELFDSGSITFFGGPTFRWNILNYGRLKNNVRIQDARLQQLLIDYQETVLRAAREVEDAMVGFLRTQEEAGYLAKSVKAASSSVDLSLVQYREGAVDYQRVLDSQDALVAQQDIWTDTKGAIARNLIAMYKALGGGWQMRNGKPFVPADIQQQMRERTDWGKMLEPQTTRLKTVKK